MATDKTLTPPPSPRQHIHTHTHTHTHTHGQDVDIVCPSVEFQMVLKAEKQTLDRGRVSTHSNKKNSLQNLFNITWIALWWSYSVKNAIWRYVYTKSCLLQIYKEIVKEKGCWYWLNFKQNYKFSVVWSKPIYGRVDHLIDDKYPNITNKQSYLLYLKCSIRIPC